MPMVYTQCTQSMYLLCFKNKVCVKFYFSDRFIKSLIDTVFIMSGAENNSILCRDCNESNKFYQRYPSWLGCLKAWGHIVISNVMMI